MSQLATKIRNKSTIERARRRCASSRALSRSADALLDSLRTSRISSRTFVNRSESSFGMLWLHRQRRVVVRNQLPAPVALYPHSGEAIVTGNGFAFVLPIHN